MRYLSVCSGIESASVAWHTLGWKPEAFAEIEPFPSAVLAHRFPNVPNMGDMTKYKEWKIAAIDVLVGGTPCQSFSVAGLRKGLADPRGNLMLTFGAIASHFKPTWLVWENVPGVLSSHGGRDFGTFLGMLAELGYGFAYRILDAQYFGVAQRRRRVFVVGYLGDWRRAASVLFESEGLCGYPAPSREAGKGFASVAGTLAANGGGTNRPAGNCNELDFCIPTIMAHGQANAEIRDDGGAPSLTCNHEAPILAFNAQGSDSQGLSCGEVTPALDKSKIPAVSLPAVRRLTPRECERLQGFPDDWTRIPWKNRPAEDCPDGPRYKACGNSMAVPVMRWIGERIQAQL